jgi:hypothetical protein
MAGLARIAKSLGAININGTTMVWDHVTDVAVPEAEMPMGSDRWKASERKRWLPQIEAAAKARAAAKDTPPF